MKRIEFKHIKTDLKRPLLDSITEALLCGEVSTRAKAKRISQASFSSVSKVADAMVGSRIMDERLYAEKSGERPCYHIKISDAFTTLAVDLSRDPFAVYLMSGGKRCKFSDIHSYDPYSSLEDNILAFISRIGLKIRQRSLTVGSICVIYADKTDVRSTRRALSHLPAIHDKVKVERAVSSVFRKAHIIHTEVSGAIADALRFGIIDPDLSRNGISYVFVGSYVSSLHVSANGDIFVCDAAGLILDDGMTVDASISSAPSAYTLTKTATRLANFMYCAFKADSIIIESDLFTFDTESMRYMAKQFALAGLVAPNTVSSDKSPPVCVIGAVRRSTFELIRRYVTASNE